VAAESPVSGGLVELQPKAENYPPEILGELSADIGSVGAAYRRISSELSSVAKGTKNFAAIYVEGLYGSGKTFLLRKIAHDILTKEELSNLFPIYFYLGEMDFLLLDALKSYINDVENYIGKRIAKPNIVGKPDDWKKKNNLLEWLKKEVDQASSRARKAEQQTEEFFKIIQKFNEQGYYPLLIFDEFERVVLTGDGLRSSESRAAFATFAEKYLELTRGHLYNGAFIVATTKSIAELVKMGYEREPRIRDVFQRLGVQSPENFPLVRAHIVYDYEAKLSWGAVDLELLAMRYNLVLHRDILHLLSEVLPTPRAVIQIHRLAIAELGGKPGPIPPKEFYKIMEPRIKDFVSALKREKIDNRFLVTSQAKWLERFIKLLEEGYFVIRRSVYLEVAKTLELEGRDEKALRQKASSFLTTLSEYGLYEKLGAGEYVLKPAIMAYALGIDRLPTGQSADLRTLIEEIKVSIKERRERIKSYQKESTKKSD